MVFMPDWNCTAAEIKILISVKGYAQNSPAVLLFR